MVSARAAVKKTSAPVAEVVQFDMHPNLLLDVIKRQAGTLAKAILEGVMNSVDAKCKECRVTITANRVTIQDDGKGIMEREHIDKFFKTFGQPHTKEEAKIYGTFRMGRGQMFSFGVNKWRTGPFTMNVDVKNRGLHWDLFTEPKVHNGCNIEIDLYDPMLPSDIAECERTIKRWVGYAPSQVYINGKLANKDPKEEKWDHILDEAYIRLNRGAPNLTVYNLGVHTMDVPASRYGIGGVIVSRKKLEVNFARNDVQSTCKVWKVLKPLVDQKAQQVITKKASINDAERQRLIDLVSQGDFPENAKDLNIFTAVTGRHFSAAKLYRELCWRYNKKLTFAPEGSRVGDRVFKQRMAFVLSTETLEAFDKEPEEIVRILKKLMNRHDWIIDIVDFKDLSEVINEQYDIINDDDLTIDETVWLSVATHGYEALLQSTHEGANRWEWRNKLRKLVVGLSECADGWTDSKRYIAINRPFMKWLTLDVRGVTSLAALLLHESCHETPSLGEHDHNMEFFENYHDRSIEGLPAAVHSMLLRIPIALENAGKAVGRTQLREADRRVETVMHLKGLILEMERKEAECLKKESSA